MRDWDFGTIVQTVAIAFVAVIGSHQDNGGDNRVQAIFKCKRCGATWNMDSVLSDPARRAVAEIVHSGQMLPAVRRLMSEGLVLKDSKAIVSHLTRTNGKCHRCSNDLADKSEVQNCPKCKSLNLNW